MHCDLLTSIFDFCGLPTCCIVCYQFNYHLPPLMYLPWYVRLADVVQGIRRVGIPDFSRHLLPVSLAKNRSTMTDENSPFRLSS